MPADSDDVIHELAVGGAAAVASIVERARSSSDVTTVVAAAVFAPGGNDELMRRAAALAVTTRDRQLVTIAMAYLDGDVDRVDDMARDHLVDHPDSVLVAWITAASKQASRPNPRGPHMSAIRNTRSSRASADSERSLGTLRRPWFRWLLAAVAFPPSGYVANLVAGRADSVPSALLAGLIAGAGIGTAQWVLLRHRSIGTRWIPATAGGLAAGVAAGAALVSYRTDITSLAVMGAVSGLGVGIAQAAFLRPAGKAVGWALATAALWALGWTVTTSAGIDVDEQWVVFGSSGCLVVALLQSTFIDSVLPPPAGES